MTLTLENRLEIIRRVQNGEKRIKLAEEFNISKQSVSKPKYNNLDLFNHFSKSYNDLILTINSNSSKQLTIDQYFKRI